MGNKNIHILLDQNVPRQIADWFRSIRPDWKIQHTSEINLDRKTDEEILNWAREHMAIVITFDEDFADLRIYPPGTFYGIIRLRVWPTTLEETQTALERLLKTVPEEDLTSSLIILDKNHIRIRKR